MRFLSFSSIGCQERDGFFLVGRNKDFQWQDLEKKKAPEMMGI